MNTSTPTRAADPLRPATLSRALALVQRLASQIRGLGRAPDTVVSTEDERAVYHAHEALVAEKVTLTKERDRIQAELAAERAAHAKTKAGAVVDSYLANAAAQRLATSTVPASAPTRPASIGTGDEDAELRSVRQEIAAEAAKVHPDARRLGVLTQRAKRLRETRGT